MEARIKIEIYLAQLAFFSILLQFVLTMFVLNKISTIIFAFDHVTSHRFNILWTVLRISN